MTDKEKIALLSEALEEFYGEFAAPKKSVRVHDETFESTYRMTSGRYNRLTAQARHAIRMARSN